LEFGALIDPVISAAELVELSQKLERWGYSHFWYPDEKFFRECYIGLTLVAVHTRKLVLGPAVTDPYSRHPIMTAAAIGTLAEVAPGRVWLGFGAGGRGLREMGINQERPARALREAILIIRDLLAGKSVDYHGEVIRLDDRPLDFTPPADIPIFIGTGHGRMIQQLAGELADAVMLANYATPDTLRKGLEWVERGASRGGRTLADVHLISRVDVAVNTDRQAARMAVAPKILSAMRASYPALNYLDDLPPFELSSEFMRVLGRKDYQTRTYYANPAHSAPLIPDALTDHLAVAGTPEEVVERLRAIAEMGFHQITIRAVPSGDQTMTGCLGMIAEQVLPKIRDVPTGASTSKQVDR
jgi:5,10-methylenetetrahydromethanopterin reductase